MKRILLSIIAAASMLAAMAQTNLAAYASEAMARCPVTVVEGLSLEKVLFNPDAKTLTYSYIVAPQAFGNLKKTANMLRDVKIDEYLTASDPDVISVRNMCTTQGVSLVYEYTSAGDTFSFLISPSDIE